MKYPAIEKTRYITSCTRFVQVEGNEEIVSTRWRSHATVTVLDLHTASSTTAARTSGAWGVLDSHGRLRGDVLHNVIKRQRGCVDRALESIILLDG